MIEESVDGGKENAKSLCGKKIFNMMYLIMMHIIYKGDIKGALLINKRILDKLVEVLEYDKKPGRLPQ